MPDSIMTATFAKIDAAARASLAERAEASALPQRRLRTVKWADAQAVSTASYCVKGLIPRQAVVLIVGESGTGKTFLAAKMATHIAESALGKFFGRRVANGYVVIVASENPSSVENRLAAWRASLNVSGANLEITKDRIDIVEPDGRRQLFDTLSAIALEVGGVAAVFIDTAACAMPGADENASQGMGYLISAAQWIRDELNCAVVIVHQTGKDQTKGARGHSSLKAAADVVIEVAGTDGVRTAAVTKSRDGATGDEIRFDLRRIVVGVDADGDEVSTCVVEPAMLSATAKTRRPKTGLPLLAFEALERVHAKHGSVATLDQTYAEFVTAAQHIESGHRKSRFSGAITSLKTGKYVIGDGQHLWIPGHRTESPTPKGVSVISVHESRTEEHRFGEVR